MQSKGLAVREPCSPKGVQSKGLSPSGSLHRSLSKLQHMRHVCTPCWASCDHATACILRIQGGRWCAAAARRLQPRAVNRRFYTWNSYISHLPHAEAPGRPTKAPAGAAGKGAAPRRPGQKGALVPPEGDGAAANPIRKRAARLDTGGWRRRAQIQVLRSESGTRRRRRRSGRAERAPGREHVRLNRLRDAILIICADHDCERRQSGEPQARDARASAGSVHSSIGK